MPFIVSSSWTLGWDCAIYPCPVPVGRLGEEVVFPPKGSCVLWVELCPRK